MVGAGAATTGAGAGVSVGVAAGAACMLIGIFVSAGTEGRSRGIGCGTAVRGSVGFGMTGMSTDTMGAWASDSAGASRRLASGRRNARNMGGLP